MRVVGDGAADDDHLLLARTADERPDGDPVHPIHPIDPLDPIDPLGGGARGGRADARDRDDTALGDTDDTALGDRDDMAPIDRDDVSPGGDGEPAVPAWESGPRAPQGEGIRLQRVLAAAGLGSRRVCEVLIDEGRVEVDGVRVEQHGMRVDPQHAVIRVDGERVLTRTDLTYLVLNKPRGVLAAMSDDRGRPTVGDYVADRRDRLFHVGRLDADSEGLLLLTNDGELAHRLTHPSFGALKTYLVEVPGPVPRDVGRRLRRGIDLDDGPVAVDAFAVVDADGNRALVEIVLHEGRKHIVRRLMAEVGHPVSRLVRTAIGPIRLETLKPGRLRHLTRHELTALYSSVGM